MTKKIYPEQISIVWSVEDVLGLEDNFCRTYADRGMTRQEAARVLHEVEQHHDANEGVTWDTLEYWVKALYGYKFLRV